MCHNLFFRLFFTHTLYFTPPSFVYVRGFVDTLLSGKYSIITKICILYFLEFNILSILYNIVHYNFIFLHILCTFRYFGSLASKFLNYISICSFSNTFQYRKTESCHFNNLICSLLLILILHPDQPLSGLSFPCFSWINPLINLKPFMNGLFLIFSNYSLLLLCRFPICFSIIFNHNKTTFETY